MSSVILEFIIEISAKHSFQEELRGYYVQNSLLCNIAGPFFAATSDG